ncbi:MAG: hypothetical protein EA420_02105, partial [Candidatus Competibacteraceae bacterium]
MTLSTLVTEPGNGTLEIFPLPTDTELLRTLIADVFQNYWDQIYFGTAVQGAVWEVRAPNAPQRISMLDGYLTVDFGHWHFHLCIGEHRGARSQPCSPELARHRRTARAELYRQLREDGCPHSWGLRLFNGQNEQQMTVFLPNPYLTVEQKILKEPRWEHLALWDHLRQTYLGL